MGYIDIHCHILPSLDDGAQSLGMSLRMADAAYKSGVSAIVATVHSYGKGEGFVHPSKYRSSISLLRDAIKKNGIDIKIISGMEVFADEDFDEKLSREMFLPIGGKYLLTEFIFDERLGFMLDVAKKIKSVGLTPIIAHPERYDAIFEKPENAYELANAGCLLQSNKGSFFGKFGESEKKAAEFMLKNGLLYAIASDAHDDMRRTTKFSHIGEYLKNLGGDYEQKLLIDNPSKIIGDSSI